MKTTEEIYSEMRTVFAEETGVEVSDSGDLAVRLYAVAAQIYALHVQCEWVTNQCFPQSAEGEYLDHHAEMRGLKRRAAVAAGGNIRFYVDAAVAADIFIAAGTVCMTAGLIRFKTTESVTLNAGSLYVDAAAQAMEAGTTGNVSMGSILSMSVAPVGVSRCSNPNAFSGGADEEDDDTLRARVLNSYKRMPNGANAAFYEQGALSFDEVAAVTVLPRKRGVGTVDLVVATAAGVPNNALLQELTAYFETKREIAVDLAVLAPKTVTVNMVVTIQVEENEKFAVVAAAVRAMLQKWFTGERLGKNVLLAELGSLVFSVDSVSNCAISIPAADLAIAGDELPVLGTITVEEMA